MTTKTVILGAVPVKISDGSGVTTVRIVGGVGKLSDSVASPPDLTQHFPQYAGDNPFTFAAGVTVWAWGSGSAHVMIIPPAA